MQTLASSQKILNIPIEALIETPDEKNPNKMSDEQFASLIESIKIFGFRQPLVVRAVGSKYEVIDGNHRKRALQTLGATSVESVVIEATDAQVSALRVAINRNRGELDFNVLQSVFVELVHSGEYTVEQLPLLGFDPGEVDALLAPSRPDDFVDLDAPITATNAEPKQKVWSLEVPCDTKNTVKDLRSRLLAIDSNLMVALEKCLSTYEALQ